jgi:hypothetical protein
MPDPLHSSAQVGDELTKQESSSSTASVHRAEPDFNPVLSDQAKARIAARSQKAEKRLRRELLEYWRRVTKTDRAWETQHVCDCAEIFGKYAARVFLIHAREFADHFASDDRILPFLMLKVQRQVLEEILPPKTEVWTEDESSRCPKGEPIDLSVPAQPIDPHTDWRPPTLWYRAIKDTWILATFEMEWDNPRKGLRVHPFYNEPSSWIKENWIFAKLIDAIQPVRKDLVNLSVSTLHQATVFDPPPLSACIEQPVRLANDASAPDEPARAHGGSQSAAEMVYGSIGSELKTGEAFESGTQSGSPLFQAPERTGTTGLCESPLETELQFAEAGGKSIGAPASDQSETTPGGADLVMKPEDQGTLGKVASAASPPAEPAQVARQVAAQIGFGGNATARLEPSEQLSRSDLWSLAKLHGIHQKEIVAKARPNSQSKYAVDLFKKWLYRRAYGDGSDGDRAFRDSIHELIEQARATRLLHSARK